MADPFVAEIRIFPFDFAPTRWATCDGQLLPISQNTALFSLLGTTYGGNGQTTFGLPDLRGAASMHPGQGPGLSDYFLGQTQGSDTYPLLISETPSHPHSLGVWASDPADRFQASGASLCRSNNGNAWASAQQLAPMSPLMVAPAGGGQPHNNMMPFLTLNYCIALQGVFPPRG